jgi:hypothetical protein
MPMTSQFRDAQSRSYVSCDMGEPPVTRGFAVFGVSCFVYFSFSSRPSIRCR